MNLHDNLNRKPTANSTCAKGVVYLRAASRSCYKDSFVLRVKFSACRLFCASKSPTS